MKNLRLITEAWKTSPSLWKTRRQALALVFSGLVVTYGYDEAVARSIHGGIAASGGGASVTLTPWTITELSGGAQTNVPIEIWVPFSAAGGLHPIVSTDAIQVLDADGVTPLLVQEDNTTSDLSPDIRGKFITAFLPSVSSSQARQLTIQKVANTSPTPGTAITTAEVIAACALDVVATLDHANGTTYTASMNTALAALPWSAKTAAANQGKWRDGANGGLVDEWICSCPFKNGGTAAPNNLTFWMSVSAYKAQRGAVSAGNPIIGVKVKHWIENSYTQVSSGYTNDWYDLTVTAGSNSQSWVGSSPAQTLTLSSNGGNNNRPTASVPSPLFTRDMIGMVIADNTSAAVIVGYTDSTHVTLRQMDTMSGTTITSGNWRIFGMNHQYAAAPKLPEIWYGGTPAISSRNLDSTLGAAWNAGAGTGGPFTYFKECGIILPYSTLYSAVTNDVTNLDAQGTNPTGFSFPGGQGRCGDITMYMPDVGGRPDIAPVPGWYVGGLIKNDTNGKRVIFENAQKATNIPWRWRDQSTGKVTLLNNGTNYVTDRVWSGTNLPQANSYASSGAVQNLTDWTTQIAHHPDMYLIPYFLTGDFYWAEARQFMIFWGWAGNNPTYYGSQLTRMACASSELRGNGWLFRDLALAFLTTPDRNPSPLGMTRSHLSTYYTNQFTATNSGTPGTSPYPGINLGLVNNTGSGKTYATSGFRDMGQGSSSSIGAWTSPWQLGYMGMAFFHIKAAGCLNSDSSAFMSWFMEGLTGAAANANVVVNWCSPDYRLIITDQSGTFYNSWTDVYRLTATLPGQMGANKRNVTGTGITLSAISGAGITVTMPAGYFTAGQSFYVGGMVEDLHAASIAILPPFGAAVSSITYSGGKAHVTTTAPHGMPSGVTLGNVTISGASPSGYNGSFQPQITGANTFDYTVADPGSTPATGTIKWSMGAIGSGYAASDTIDLAVSDTFNHMTVSRRARVTVSSVDGSGGITGLTLTDGGLYTAITPGNKGLWGETASQFATSGSGTGFTFTNLKYYSGFGTGIITAVSGDQLTLSTTGSWAADLAATVYCLPFAQTGLTTNKIQVPAPAPGDSNGSSSIDLGPYVPQPYTGYYEYWDIARQCAFMANAQGFANGSTANTNVAGAYTGGSNVKWKVA